MNPHNHIEKVNKILKWTGLQFQIQLSKTEFKEILKNSLVKRSPVIEETKLERNPLMTLEDTDIPFVIKMQQALHVKHTIVIYRINILCWIW